MGSLIFNVLRESFSPIRRALFFFIILISSAFAANPISQSSSVSLMSESFEIDDFSVQYTFQAHEERSLPDTAFIVKEDLDWKITPNQSSLGKTQGRLWVKFSVQNETNANQSVYVHENLSYRHKSIVFYGVSNGEIKDVQMFTPKERAYLTKGVAVFKVNIPAGKSKEIWMRIQSHSHDRFSISLNDPNHSQAKLVGALDWLKVAFGFMAALLFINMLIYPFSRNKEQLYYSLYIFLSIIWMSYSYGLVSSSLDLIGAEAYSLNLTLIAALAFLVLFLKEAFKTQEYYKLENTVLNTAAVLLIFNFLFGIVWSAEMAMRLFDTMAAVTIFLTLFSAISIYIKGHKAAVYYLIGHSFFFGFTIVAALFYKGLLPYNFLTEYSVGLGILLEAITLFMLVAFRLKENEDIKRAKVASETVMEASDLWSEIVDSAQLGAWRWNVQTNELTTTETWKQMLGYGERDKFNSVEAWSQLIHPDDLDAVNQSVEAHLVGETDFYEVEFRLRTKDGGYKWMQAKGKVIERTPQGAPVIFVGVHADIDSIKKTEEEAINTAQAKSLFLANMSHEIRTPLNALIGLSDVQHGCHHKNDVKELEELLTDINRSSLDLLRIIDDVLDSSKIEAGQLTIVNEPVDIEQLVNSVQSLYQKAAADKGLCLEVVMEQEMAEVVVTDEVRLGQVLKNLVSNAVKFTEQGFVKVMVSRSRVSDSQFNYNFKVSDSGIGIRDEALMNLFQSFAQADSSITRKYGGTGLGLSISNSLVKMMGGERIFVESTYGEGSTFEFNLTLKVSDSKPTIQVEDLSLESLVGKSILLVEDITLNQKVIKRLLQPIGVNVTVASNGQEAVEFFESASKSKPLFDLVFMDIQMPIMNGYEATKQIRQLGFKLPIIALTAGAMEDDKAKAFNAGMSGHLSKPIKRETLEKVLMNWLADETEGRDSGSTAETESDELYADKYLDVAYGLTMFDVDKEFHFEMCRDLIGFLRERKPLIESLLEKAIAGELSNYQDLEVAVHSISGISKQVGAIYLADLAKKLEGKSREDRVFQSQELETISDAIEQTIVSLQNYVKTQSH